MGFWRTEMTLAFPLCRLDWFGYEFTKEFTNSENLKKQKKEELLEN
jgi:hypothetical protein